MSHAIPEPGGHIQWVKQDHDNLSVSATDPSLQRTATEQVLDQMRRVAKTRLAVPQSLGNAGSALQHLTTLPPPEPLPPKDLEQRSPPATQSPYPLTYLEIAGFPPPPDPPASRIYLHHLRRLPHRPRTARLHQQHATRSLRRSQLYWHAPRNRRCVSESDPGVVR